MKRDQTLSSQDRKSRHPPLRFLRLPIAAYFLAAVWLPLHTRAAPADTEPTGPNIILIVGDNVSWAGLGSTGSTYYETPNIDRLSSEGLSFTNGYVCSPTCLPSRACLMSGRFLPPAALGGNGPESSKASGSSRGNSEAWQQTGWAWNEFGSEIPTIAERLQAAGYVTGHFGKWHLPPLQPDAHGFDASLTLGKWDHFDFTVTPPVEIPEGAYFNDLMTDYAIRFMETSVAARKKFFLYFPSFLIHGPVQAKPEVLKRFKEKRPTSRNDRAGLAAMTYSLDESVGMIMTRMAELGIAEDTLVIFTSDHGNRHNLPLRGGKYSLYEGGIRVPFIFRWKNVIQPGTASDQPIMNVDLYPTFLELAGGAAPAGYALDGISIAPILRQPERRLRRDALYWHAGAVVLFEEIIPNDAVRVGDFKLIEHYEADTTRVELFDLRADLTESKDLSVANPSKVRELQLKLAAWRESVLLQQPTPPGSGPRASSPFFYPTPGGADGRPPPRRPGAPR